jgi:tetratricopeptide (TPR) repeat protein
MLELAKAEFESVVRESPEMPEALFNLGLVYYKFGNVQEALKCLNRALRHLPNDKDIRRFIEMISDDQEEVPQG